MKIIFQIAVGICLLASCTQVDISKPPILVTPKNAADAVGIDVYARQRARGNPVPSFRGQNTVEVRTFGKLGGGGYGEIENATCELDSGIYTTAFNTPANIVVPDYGPNSPAIFIQCKLGERSKSVTVNAINLTNQQRNSTAAGTGILGAIIIGAVNEASRDNETDNFGYAPIRVQLGN